MRGFHAIFRRSRPARYVVILCLMAGRVAGVPNAAGADPVSSISALYRDLDLSAPVAHGAKHGAICPGHGGIEILVIMGDFGNADTDGDRP